MTDNVETLQAMLTDLAQDKPGQVTLLHHFALGAMRTLLHKSNIFAVNATSGISGAFMETQSLPRASFTTVPITTLGTPSDYPADISNVGGPSVISEPEAELTYRSPVPKSRSRPSQQEQNVNKEYKENIERIVKISYDMAEEMLAEYDRRMKK